jgi:hypothetical protein
MAMFEWLMLVYFWGLHVQIAFLLIGEYYENKIPNFIFLYAKSVLTEPYKWLKIAIFGPTSYHRTNVNYSGTLPAENGEVTALSNGCISNFLQPFRANIIGDAHGMLTLLPPPILKSCSTVIYENLSEHKEYLNDINLQCFNLPLVKNNNFAPRFSMRILC